MPYESRILTPGSQHATLEECMRLHGPDVASRRSSLLRSRSALQPLVNREPRPNERTHSSQSIFYSASESQQRLHNSNPHRSDDTSISLTDGRGSAWTLQCHLLSKVRRRVRRGLGGKQSALLVLCTIGLLISSCGNSVLFKKLTTAMPNYGWFLSQVTCFAYVPIFGVVVMASRVDITEEMTRFPKYNFALMGLMDSMVCLMCIVGGAFTSGPTQLVLGQAVIPVTLGLATVLLGQRFHFLQYIGGVVIIAGVLASKWPSLSSRLEPFTESPVKDIPSFNIIYACSALPGALSQIWKEIAFKDRELNVNYMQFWVALFQVIVGFLVAPLNSLSLLGTQRIPLHRIPSLVTRGSACLLMGKNSIVEECGGPLQPLCDDCEGAWIPVLAYLVFNVFYNSFTLLIVKHGGAALSFVIATLRLPLASICFYSKAIVGVDATEPSIFDLFGLILLVIGLGIYRLGFVITLEEGSNTRTTTLTAEVGEDGYQCSLHEDPERSRFVNGNGRIDDTLLLRKEEEEEEEEEEVAFATLVVSAGPHILKIHHHRTRPLYLRPLLMDNPEIRESYRPPSSLVSTLRHPKVPKESEKQQKQDRRSSREDHAHHLITQPRAAGTRRTDDCSAGTGATIRLPRRRTMHDFREAQIQKIHQRRLPFEQLPDFKQQLMDNYFTSPSAASLTSLSNRHPQHPHHYPPDILYCHDVDDDPGHLSDGSVNSLTSVTRPHPLDLTQCSQYDLSSPSCDLQTSHQDKDDKEFPSPQLHYSVVSRSSCSAQTFGQWQQHHTLRDDRLYTDALTSPSFRSTSPPSSLRQHLTPIRQPDRPGLQGSTTHRLPPLSIMLDGGLDLTVPTSRTLARQ